MVQFSLGSLVVRDILSSFKAFLGKLKASLGSGVRFGLLRAFFSATGPAPATGPALAIAAALLSLPPAPVTGQEVIDLPAEDQVVSLDLEVLHRLGGISATGWQAFGHIQGAGFDEAGNLYLFDNQISRYYVVSPGGSLIREFGTVGEGPGEIRSQVAFGVARNGQVVSLDQGHMAYQILGPDGLFVRQSKIADPSELNTPGFLPEIDVISRLVRFDYDFLRLSTDGSFVVSATVPLDALSGIFGGMIAMIEEAGLGEPPEGIEEIRRMFEAPETTPGRTAIERHYLFGESLEWETLTSAWDFGTPFHFGQFAPALHYDLLPDGRLVYADSSNYEVKVITEDGELASLLRRPIAAEEVTPDIRNKARDLEQISDEVPDGLPSGNGGVHEFLQRRDDLLARSPGDPRAPHHLGRVHMGQTPGRGPMAGRRPYRHHHSHRRIHRHPCR